MYERTEALPVWRMRFAHHPGLLVRVTVPTVQARALAPKLIPLLGSGRRQDVVTALVRLAGPFADSLLSWTLGWAGHPVPATRAGVLRVDEALLAEVLQEWVRLWPAEDQQADPAELDAQLAGLPMVALVPDHDEAAPEPVAG